MKFAIKLKNGEIIDPIDTHFLFISSVSSYGTVDSAYENDISNLLSSIQNHLYKYIGISTEVVTHHGLERINTCDRIIPIDNVSEYIIINTKYIRDNKIKSIIDDK